MRILIVEDEIRISNLLKLYLERASYVVEVSDDGNEGLIKAVNEHFDLIILDVLIPGKNGFKVLEELRKHKKTPVIILSAKSSESDRQHGLELGADEYILKPFSPRDLTKKINEIIRLHQMG